MKILVSTLLLLLSACATPMTQELAGPPLRQAVSAEHAWLMQFTGEWGVATPEGTPAEGGSSEHIRSIGGNWIAAEGHMSHGPQSYTYVLTIGYDTRKKSYVGTWIDTVNNMLWTYTGTLDKANNTLALESEGPSFDDANETGQYRDELRLITPNHKRITSFALKDDGQWEQYMSMDYYRKK